MNLRSTFSLALIALLAQACGARTGLLVPDAEAPSDAGMDAAMIDDAGFDAGFDAACPDLPVPLVHRDVQTVLLLDRSGSMSLTWDGLPFGAGLPSRWMIVRDTLAAVLPPYDDTLALGVKVFPRGVECDVRRGFDVPPRVGAVSDILDVFDVWAPEGGTPTAAALRSTLEDLDASSDSPSVIVVALDGGPNCNPDPGVPPDMCICTGPRRSCLAPAPEGPQACLDEIATLDVVRRAYEERGVPVVVVGIDDPTRPDLSDFLDEMAVAGGWPRPVGAERRFFNAREPEDLAAAFSDIAELIARCVLSVPDPPPEGSEIVVRFDGAVVPRDQDHVEGWDWTDEARGAMAFFGASCDALRFGAPRVEADILCAE